MLNILGETYFAFGSKNCKEEKTWNLVEGEFEEGTGFMTQCLRGAEDLEPYD